MPPALYNKDTGLYYENKEEMIKKRKERDLKANKIRYWRKNYGYDLDINDYDDFNQRINIIKNVYPLHDYIINFSNKKKLNGEELEFYVKHVKKIKKGLEIKDYLRTLNKIVEKKEDDNIEKKITIHFE
jgi:hypothetical protein